VRVPRALQEDAMRVTRAMQALEPKLGPVRSSLEEQHLQRMAEDHG